MSFFVGIVSVLIYCAVMDRKLGDLELPELLAAGLMAIALSIAVELFP